MVLQRFRPGISQALAASLGILAVCLVVCFPATAHAQQSYGQYYQKQLKQTGGGGMGLGSSDRYLYDKYFYRNPSVSPWLSAARGGNLSGTSYTASVRPELERRRAAERSQAAYIQQRKLKGNVGDTRYPGSISGGGIDASYLKPVPQRPSTPSAYYNHWYGGQGNR